MTMFFWPIAVHMTTLADGSLFLMQRVAVMPSMIGMVMSISTRSGLAGGVLFHRLLAVGGLAGDS